MCSEMRSISDINWWKVSDIYIIFKKLIKKHILTLKYICHIYYIARLYINLSPIWYMVMGNETALVE